MYVFVYLCVLLYIYMYKAYMPYCAHGKQSKPEGIDSLNITIWILGIAHGLGALFYLFPLSTNASWCYFIAFFNDNLNNALLAK